MVMLTDNQVLDLTKNEKIYERESKKVLESNSTPVEPAIQEPLVPCGIDCMVEIAKQESEQRWEEFLESKPNSECDVTTSIPFTPLPNDFELSKCETPYVHLPYVPREPITPSWVNDHVKVEQVIVSKDKISFVLDAINTRLDAFYSLDGSSAEINGQVTALLWVKKILTEQ